MPRLRSHPAHSLIEKLLIFHEVPGGKSALLAGDLLGQEARKAHVAYRKGPNTTTLIPRCCRDVIVSVRCGKSGSVHRSVLSNTVRNWHCWE